MSDTTPNLLKYRRPILGLFFVLSFVSVFFLMRLKFAFDFEQFFPLGDEDLVFFQKFIKEFETDDNFLLIGVKRTEGVFEKSFLEKVDTLTQKAIDLPYAVQVQSLTNTKLPVKSPFGILPIPVIHIDDTSFYDTDRAKVVKDERFVRSLISEDATAMVVFVKTKDRINLDESEILMRAVDSLVKPMNFEGYHYLGRAHFQKELVAMEKREVAVSTIVAAILVAIVMGLIFRRWQTVVVALSAIGFSMLFFLGVLGLWGRELSAMAALYPVLIVIVGTSDVIHVLSKYIDERRRGLGAREAMWTTTREIGLATLMTAVTTATGFATLVTSRVLPIQEFGINAAVGVMITYITVLLFTMAILPLFDATDLIVLRGGDTRIEKIMAWTYRVTKTRVKAISLIALAVFGLCILGITKIKTNYSIEDNLPTKSKVTTDFYFFEKLFSGFRPLEYAAFAQNGHKIDDFEVMTAIAKTEEYIRSFASIRSVVSPTMIYKSINQMNNDNRSDAYTMPTDAETFEEYKAFSENLPKATANILISKDSTKARIATRILDLGADSVMAVGDRIDAWIAKNIDTSIVTFKRTGTGYIIDKNAMYVRTDLIEGLAWEIGLIAIIMGFMLRNFRMIIIFLVPNIFPLIFAGALLGFLGVDLDASISMIFTVVFGIAIDDTIHFLSSFRINQRHRKLSVDEALRVTLHETGKPVFLTTVILFFGFLVMIFSIHPPSVTVGKLIAVTLLSALMSDMFIVPLLIRWWIKDEKQD